MYIRRSNVSVPVGSGVTILVHVIALLKKNLVNLLHIINIANKRAYLYSGIPVISTVTPASGGTCAELCATLSKVPHASILGGATLEFVGATSRILTLLGIG